MKWCFPASSARRPDTPNQALPRMYCQWQAYLADIVRNSRYPTSYYTQHCSPWLQSHVLALSLSGSKAERSLWFAASLQTVRCTMSVWFLAALPSQFIFGNSRRLLGLYNVTLMRQVRGCSGSNLLFFFLFLCPNCDGIGTAASCKMQAPTWDLVHTWNMLEILDHSEKLLRE